MNLYFDNATTTWPKPPVVRAAVGQALEVAGNPGRGGHRWAMNAAHIVWDARTAAARFFGCDDPERVVFTGNDTQSLNTVLHGLVKPGGHVVISDVEHNAVLRPLTEWSIPYTAVTTVPGDPQATVAAFAAAIRPQTALVLCTHASNVTGQIQPIAALGALCRQRRIPFAVDAAQSGGILPLSMATDSIDFLCLPGHKGLYGPAGSGLLLSSGRYELRPYTVGGTGNASLDPHQPAAWPEHLESGTPPVPAIAGLGAALRWLSPRRAEVSAHEFSLAAHLWDRLSHQPGILVHTPRPDPQTTAPLLLITIEGLSSEQAAERLAATGIAVRAGLHCAPAGHRKLGTLPDGGIRIAPGAFQTQADGELLCKNILTLAKK